MNQRKKLPRLHGSLALPLKDEECSECVWLPMCAGGCPHHRLYDHKACVGVRNEPEKYVLALPAFPPPWEALF